MIPPSIITSTRYYSAESHINQLLKQGHSTFALEQQRAMNCLQQPGAVLGRTAATPNYRQNKFFGSSLVRDYGRVLIKTESNDLFPVAINDICYIEHHKARIERIMRVECDGRQGYLFAGVNQDGIPLIASPAQIRRMTDNEKQSVTFRTKVPEVIA